MTIQRADDDHFWRVASRLLAGRVVPFLGAGANLCGRPEGERFRRGHYLPSGLELAQLLAHHSRYPVPEHLDLLQVSQYMDAVLGERVLYEHLRNTFDADYPPTTLHELLAELPGMLRERSMPSLLVLTTNYDDALERALAARDEPYELLWYEAKKGSTCGRFIHRGDAGPIVVERPNEYDGLGGGDRTVILKLHGAVDRSNPEGDSYVITEDDYIEYLTRSDISRQIPVTLKQRMSDSHFLFLGYSLRDWNLRVILHRIWGEQSLAVKSWAIQREEPNPKLSEVEQRLWTDRGDVDVLYVPLDEYVSRLQQAIDSDVAFELAP